MSCTYMSPNDFAIVVLITVSFVGVALIRVATAFAAFLSKDKHP